MKSVVLQEYTVARGDHPWPGGQCSPECSVPTVRFLCSSVNLSCQFAEIACANYSRNQRVKLWLIYFCRLLRPNLRARE